MKTLPITETLAATLGALAQDSRERLAAEKLTIEAVKAAGTAAACQGLTGATIPLGPANLEHTAAARELMAALKGFSFDWVEGVARDGERSWELRISWKLGT